MSFPHFYAGDESLMKQVDGLNPREEDHESYLDLHPVRRLWSLIIIVIKIILLLYIQTDVQSLNHSRNKYQID